MLFFVLAATVIEPTKPPQNPCVPSPCGANAVCRHESGSAFCQCLPDYFGNAVQGCKPECVLNSDCSSTQVCTNQRCRDPCPGLCGLNAECRVVNHFPACSCLPGYTGNAMQSCKVIVIGMYFSSLPTHFFPIILNLFLFSEPVPPVVPVAPVVDEQCTPCRPSPCGPYSVCREVDCRAVCSCQSTYVGAPPSCRPECIVNSDCSTTQACINQKCTNPCANICGTGAECRVINHNPICQCPRGYTGDPFIQCRPLPIGT